MSRQGCTGSIASIQSYETSVCCNPILPNWHTTIRWQSAKRFGRLSDHRFSAVIDLQRMKPRSDSPRDVTQMFVLTGQVHQSRNTSKHLKAPKISNRKHHLVQLRLTKKMEQIFQPDVSTEWSLDPTTHSFSSNTSPTLTLSLTNHSDRPITIYNEYLVPSRLLAEGSFTIFDLTADTEGPSAQDSLLRLCTS